MRIPGSARREKPDVAVAAGERLLAWAVADDGRVVGGTRDAVYVPDRIPWEQVEAADWDSDTETLTLTEVGTWGHRRPEHRWVLADPERLLQLVRERVTASVVLQRHVAVDARRGLRVIARRPPSGRGDLARITWVYEFDEGVDPDDPDVRRLAEEALTAARADVGLD